MYFNDYADDLRAEISSLRERVDAQADEIRELKTVLEEELGVDLGGYPAAALAVARARAACRAARWVALEIERMVVKRATEISSDGAAQRSETSSIDEYLAMGGYEERLRQTKSSLPKNIDLTLWRLKSCAPSGSEHWPPKPASLRAYGKWLPTRVLQSEYESALRTLGDLAPGGGTSSARAVGGARLAPAPLDNQSADEDGKDERVKDKCRDNFSESELRVPIRPRGVEQWLDDGIVAAPERRPHERAF